MVFLVFGQTFVMYWHGPAVWNARRNPRNPPNKVLGSIPAYITQEDTSVVVAQSHMSIPYKSLSENPEKDVFGCLLSKASNY